MQEGVSSVEHNGLDNLIELRNNDLFTLLDTAEMLKLFVWIILTLDLALSYTEKI